MAQYVPAPALASPAGAVPHNPDDADVQTRLPSICVDYLSHDWAEEDVWASWRSMTRKKNEIANGVRLENASWRTWWKQRNKLKTISPETLNWLKDSDVTWLYGPLHTAVEAVPPPKIATTEDKLDLQSGKKPILKHRTLSEILTSQRPSSPVLESLDLTSDDEDAGDDVDGSGSVSSSLEGRPGIFHTKSDTNIVRRGSTRRPSPPRVPIPSLAMVGQGQVEHGIAHGHSNDHLAAADGTTSPGANSGGGAAEKRHISFNTFVEQCISLDEPTSISPDRPVSDGAGDSDDSDDDSDVLEMRSTASSVSSSSQHASRPAMSRQGSDPKEHFTIAHIAPTLLKSNEAFPAPSPGVVFLPPSSSALHRSNSNSSSASSSSPSVDSDHGHGHGAGGGPRSYDFPGPIDQAEWDEDDDEFHELVRQSSAGSGGRAPTAAGVRSPGSAAGRVGSVNHYESSPSTSPNNSRTDLPSAATAAAAAQKPPRRGASIGSATPPSSGTTTPTGGPKANSPPVAPSPPSSAVGADSAKKHKAAKEPSPPPSPAPRQPGRSILKNKQAAAAAAAAASAGGASSPPRADGYFPDAQSLAGAAESVANGDAAAAGANDGGERRGRPVSRNSSSASLADRGSQSRSASTGPPAAGAAAAVAASGAAGGPPSTHSPSTNSGHGGASFFNPAAATAAPAPSSTGGGGRAARPPSINIKPAPARPASPDGTSGPSSAGDGASRDDYWADKVGGSSSASSSSDDHGGPTVADPAEQDRIAQNARLAEEVMKGFDGSFGAGAGAGGAAKGQQQAQDDPASYEASDEEKGDYVPTESTNPTPHSSPLIAMRPLPNSGATTAASLPHFSGPSSAPKSGGSPSAASPSNAFASLGLNSPPAGATASSPSPSGNGPAAGSPSSETGATVAGSRANGAGGVVETAKGLLGALWGMGGGSQASATMGVQSPTAETPAAPAPAKRA